MRYEEGSYAQGYGLVYLTENFSKPDSSIVPLYIRSLILKIIVLLNCQKMQQVKKGDTISVHYRGTLEDGTLFDASEGREPLQFEVGGGMVIEGFDSGVLGMAIGEKKTVKIPFDKAYGPQQESLFMEFPVENLPEDLEPEIGMVLNMTNDDGEDLQVRVVEVKDDFIVIDANHPLAGKDLIFELDLVSVKPSNLIIMP